MLNRPEVIPTTRTRTYGKILLLTIAMLMALATVAPDAFAQRHPTKPASPAVTSSAPRMKGIWEAVSYNQDLNLQSVYFVTPNIGWASGQGGTIIKTEDGGAHWTPQLGGDPQGAGDDIRDLRFVDQLHGFAAQSNSSSDNALLRTVDGLTWRASGTIIHRRTDYTFTSPTVGFVSAGYEISRTRDAGRSWQKVMDCAANVNENGLSRNVKCEIGSLSFPTSQIGYGTGMSPEVKGVFIAKTTDGGETWTISRVLENESVRNGFIIFTDANNGFVCAPGRLFATSDGGKSWDGVAGVDCGGHAYAKFADPETGWTLQRRQWNYTTNGGRSWGSRAIMFPADVNGISLPRRDRGYVVGEHGMVYRYSIVPVEHTAANSFDAPVVGASSSPLDDQVEKLAAEVEGLSAENGGSSRGGAPDATAVTATTGSSAAKAKSGGNRLGKVQALLDVIGASMPNFLARYRNLNLLFEGARTTAGMPTWLQAVKGGLAAFGSSTDKASAAASLAQLVNATDSLKIQTSVAFLKTSFTVRP